VTAGFSRGSNARIFAPKPAPRIFATAAPISPVPTTPAVNLAVQGQDQRQRVLGDGVGGVGGDADDGDAGARGGGQVDVVEAGATQGDQLRAAGGQHGQRIGVEAVVDEAAHGWAAGGERRGGGAERDLEVARLEDRPVRAAGGGVRDVEERAVIRLGVEDGQCGRGMGGHGGREEVEPGDSTAMAS